jgi:hypothetical protein
MTNWTARKKILGYGTLAAVTFAATYGYVSIRRDGVAPWSKAGAATEVIAAPAPGASAAAPGVQPANGSHYMGTPSSTGVDHVAEQRREVVEAVAAARMTIASADPAQRRMALNQLGTMAAPGAVAPELLQTLGDAALGDPEWQVRMQVVITLARIAQQMPDKSQVLPILQRASHDTNTAVANRARTALESLTGSPTG